MMIKARLVGFEHNNIADLERCLEEQAEMDKKDPKKASAYTTLHLFYSNFRGGETRRGNGGPCPRPIGVPLEHAAAMFADVRA